MATRYKLATQDRVETLTNKTLTTPTISATGFANAQHAHAGATSGGQIAHSALSGRTANDHHNQAHVLATDLALGPDHSISGATLGHVLRATAATTARFMQLSHADLGSIGTNSHATIDSHIASTANPHGVTKAQVGLSVVENTALSTWAGTASITTLGTISTGTWSATAIAVAKGGTGATTAAAAHTNLGLGSMATQNSTAIAVTGGTVSGLTSLGVSGNITVTGTVDGVDVSAHAANVSNPHAVTKAQVGLSLVENIALSTWPGTTNITTLGTIGTGTWQGTAIANVYVAGLDQNVLTTSSPAFAGLNVDSGVLYVDSVNDRVGIGTTAPNQKLHVVSTGAGALTRPLQLTNADSTTGTAAAIDFNLSPVAATITSRIQATRTNVGSAGDTDLGFWVYNSGSLGEKLTIKNAGNVGIGTTNPSYPLDVLGAGRFSGDLEVDSDLDVGAGVLFVNESGQNVGINTYTPDAQFALDVAGPIRGTVLVGPHAIQLPNAKAIFHFDGPDGNDNYTGDNRSHMGLVPTTESNLIYRPGKFGKAVQVAEATTNYIQNPSFETGTSYWLIYNGTLETTTVDSVYGNSAGSMVTSAGSNPYIYNVGAGLTVSTGTIWTLSAWVKAGDSAAIGRLATVNLREAGGAQASATSTVTKVLTSEWQRVVVTRIIVETDRTQLNHWVSLGVGAGGIGLVDGIQLEQKAYVTPYCDGSLGDGHAWTGTTHGSTSTRANGRLSYTNDVLDPNEGTVSMWVKWDKTTYSPDAYDYDVPFECNYSATTGIMLWAVWNVNRPTGALTYYGGGLSSTISTIGIGEGWHHVVATWDANAGVASLYFDGVSQGQRIFTGNIDFGSDVIDVGSWNGNSLISGLIDDLTVLSEALDADTIRAIYESNAPVFAESSVHAFRAGRGTSIWADESGFWAKAADGTDLFAVSAVNGESWGGKTLNAGDVLLGTGTSYLMFDKSLGTVTFAGDGAGLTAINGANITTGTINAERLDLSSKLTVGGAAADVNANATTISGGKITTNSITAVQIAAGTITATEITASTITGAKIAAGTITAANIAADTITATQIAANAITVSELAADSVTSAKIVAGTIVASHIAANTITATQIAAGTITATEIAATTITGAKIAAGTITAANIATDTITASQIAANAITASEIASGAVTTAKLNFTPVQDTNVVASINATAEGITINAARLNLTGVLAVGSAAADVNAGVTTISGGKITADSITATQIAANAITTSELAADSVTSAKIVAGTIVASDIASNTITATQIAVGTITATEIAASTITGAKIAAGTITADKIDVANLFSQNATIAGVLSIGTSGGIYQGTGTFVTPTTGLKMWNDGGVGRIGGYNAGAVQWYAGTDGKLYAGGGVVELGVGGIKIQRGALESTAENRILWTGGGYNAYISGYKSEVSEGTLGIAISAPNAISLLVGSHYAILNAATGISMSGLTVQGLLSTTGNVSISGNVTSGTWQGTPIANTYVAGINQNVLTSSSPAFAGLNIDSGTLYVDSANDRVGVRTASPAYPLHVSGDARITGKLGIADDPGSYSLKVNGDTYLGNYVGIGTGATSDRLTVAGDLLVWDDITADNGDFSVSVAAPAIVVENNMKLLEIGATPTTPASGTEAVMYVKNDKLIVMYNDAGTVRYKYMNLSGSLVEWTATTTAP